MTPQEIIDVVTAFRDGKKVEVKSNFGTISNWTLCVDPKWNFHEWNYRVAREPRRVWLRRDPNAFWIGNDSPSTHGNPGIEFVEVMK